MEIVLNHTSLRYPIDDDKNIDVLENGLFLIKNLNKKCNFCEVIGVFDENYNWYIEKYRMLLLEDQKEYLHFELRNSSSEDSVFFELEMQRSRWNMPINKYWQRLLLPSGFGAKIHYPKPNFYFRISDYTTQRNVGISPTLIKETDKSPYFISFSMDDYEIGSMKYPTIEFKTYRDESFDISLELVDR